MVVVHARPRSPPMTGKKIRNIWPVGERASRSSRGIIVPCACVCVCVYSVADRCSRFAHERQRRGHDDTRYERGRVRIEGSYIRTRTCARNDRHSFYRYTHLYFSLPPLSLAPSQSPSPILLFRPGDRFRPTHGY